MWRHIDVQADWRRSYWNIVNCDVKQLIHSLTHCTWWTIACSSDLENIGWRPGTVTVISILLFSLSFSVLTGIPKFALIFTDSSCWYATSRLLMSYCLYFTLCVRIFKRPALTSNRYEDDVIVTLRRRICCTLHVFALYRKLSVFETLYLDRKVICTPFKRRHFKLFDEFKILLFSYLFTG